jgi:hypothetical protein
MNANTTEATDNTDDSPQPIAELSFDMRIVHLFDDGEVITSYDGGAACSEHGPLGPAHEMNRQQCTHLVDTTEMDLPMFDSSMFVGSAASDRAIQDEAFERIAENDPERIINESQQYEV